MTERQNSEMDVVEILRDRLGARYRASHDGGRREIARVISDAMGLGHDEAEELLHRQIEGGRIRYVSRAEDDPDQDVEAQRDERTDRERRTDGDPDLYPNLTPDERDRPRAGEVPIPVMAPVVGTGTTTPPAVPIAVGVNMDAGAGDMENGYWDFAGDRAGVVPSSTRKGQVEPKGT